MKIVYIADNRNRGNYGCRATSTALSQLVSEKHEIVGRISGRYTNYETGRLFFAKYLPSWVYGKLGNIPNWEYIKKVIYMWTRFRAKDKYLLGRYDYVSQDLDKSISNLIKCLPANPELNEFDLRQYDFDAIVVNGEGSFIFSTPPRRESLVIAMLIHWAQKMGKKVFFMNAMFSDCPFSERNTKTINIVDEILAKSDLVVVRENYSYEYVSNYLPHVHPVIIPDALFSWYDLVNDEHQVLNGKYYMPQKNESDEFYYSYDFIQPYICISGTSARINYSDINELIQSFCMLTLKVKNEFNLKVYLVQACEGDDFLYDVGKITNTPVIPLETPIIAAAKILANARLLISGRYHPSIMASLGGTPCIFMKSNSHKTLSLQQLLEYDKIYEYESTPDENECNEIIVHARSMYDSGEALRNKIKNRCKALSIEARKMIDLIN
ncbi:polysaccharide pyruvyl transferase family protein [Clostridium thermosuccinogenes]|nr:polysaccharide pyruvyl transferase family protein [Pseudoclostridium thermosuccinogenes]